MTNHMRTEVYVRNDIENILRAIDRANRDFFTLLRSAEADSYRSGFVAALQAVATAFNIQFEAELTQPDDSSQLIFIDKTAPVRRALTAPNR